MKNYTTITILRCGGNLPLRVTAVLRFAVLRCYVDDAATTPACLLGVVTESGCGATARLVRSVPPFRWTGLPGCYSACHVPLPFPPRTATAGSRYLYPPLKNWDIHLLRVHHSRMHSTTTYPSLRSALSSRGLPFLCHPALPHVPSRLPRWRRRRTCAVYRSVRTTTTWYIPACYTVPHFPATLLSQGVSAEKRYSFMPAVLRFWVLFCTAYAACYLPAGWFTYLICQEGASSYTCGSLPCLPFPLPPRYKAADGPSTFLPTRLPRAGGCLPLPKKKKTVTYAFCRLPTTLHLRFWTTWVCTVLLRYHSTGWTNLPYHSCPFYYYLRYNRLFSCWQPFWFFCWSFWNNSVAWVIGITGGHFATLIIRDALFYRAVPRYHTVGYGTLFVRFVGLTDLPFTASLPSFLIMPMIPVISETRGKKQGQAWGDTWHFCTFNYSCDATTPFPIVVCIYASDNACCICQHTILLPSPYLTLYN